MSGVHPDIKYEILISAAGAATLTCGGEVLWNSDNDPKYQEEMDEVIEFDDDEQLDELVAWLVENEYLPPDLDIDIVPEDEASEL